MEASIIDIVIPLYHQAPKKRHDLLCKDLMEKSELAAILPKEIDAAVAYIEALVSKSVPIARDLVYQAIYHQQALDEIRDISITHNENSLNIILERAKHYASR